MFEYFAGVIEDRRRPAGRPDRRPGLRGDRRPNAQSDWDVLGFCFVMVAGGNDTTGALISHGVGLLDAFPDQRRLFLEDPGLIPARGERVPAAGVLGAGPGPDDHARRRGRDVVDPCRREGADALRLGQPRRLGVRRGRRPPRRTAGRGAAPRLLQRPALLHRQPSRQAPGADRLRGDPRRAPALGVDRSRGVRHRSAFTRGWQSLPATGLSGS